MNRNTEHGEPPTKKKKLNPEDVHQICGSSISVLSINSNFQIKTIVKCCKLTILKMVNAQVKTIENCPILRSLTINKNKGLKILELPSVEKAHLQNISDMSSITLPKARILHIENLPLLKYLNAPLVEEISIVDMRFDIFKSHILAPSSVARAIRLNNVRKVNFKYDAPIAAVRNCSLTICNCSLGSSNRLSNINGFDEVIIKDCSSVRFIENIQNVNKLTIINCSKLYRISSLANIQKVFISRCDSLERITMIEATKLSIEYCSNLQLLPTLSIDEMHVNHCPSLSNLNIGVLTSRLDINKCPRLESVTFANMNTFGYHNLEINMTGDNHIEHISEWTVAKLTISDNTTLESIQSIYNIKEMIIMNCGELVSISNIRNINEIFIQTCPLLESITEVYGFEHLTLIDCELLTEVQMFLANLKTTTIAQCLNLQLHLIGTSLRLLSLSDCGFMIVKNLSTSAIVNTKNARLLPDLTSSVVDGVCSAAVALKKHTNALFKATKDITFALQAYVLQSKYIRYTGLKQDGELYDCVICQESLMPHSCTFTECDHVFHLNCLSEWFIIRRTCPLCNNEL